MENSSKPHSLSASERPRVVVISGAASGIGRYFAKTCSRQGATVLALDINEAALTDLCNESQGIHPFTVDVTNTQAVEAVAAAIYEEYGAVDELVNCAAIMPCGKLLDHATDNILKVMTINYGGLVNITKAFVPGMVRQGKGEVIIFSSMLGVMPTLMTGAYAASKFATSVYAEIMAEENRDSGVTFHCVCPPPVKTPLLNQVKETVWPKIFDASPAILPADVFQAVEKAKRKKNFWVYPGKQTAIGAFMRRLFPKLVWKQVHQAEADDI